MSNPDLRDLNREEIEGFLREQEEPAYRSGQILTWLYGGSTGLGVTSIDEMKNLPAELKEKLKANFSLFTPRVIRAATDTDSTVKLLVELSDGDTIECVIIPETVKKGQTAARPWRKTLCLSSQVGCAMGCGFCRTATMGLKRNLKPSEMINQVLLARRYLSQHEPEGRIRNLVFMGMGEPLHNLKHLKTALSWMTDREGTGISKKHITVSTSGLLPEIQNFIRETEVRLAISLNATDEATRSEIMPVNQKYSLEKLLDYCRKLTLPRADRITFEYVLLKDVNDTDADAKRLVSLLHGIRAKVNLLAFNEYPGADFSRPTDERVLRFRELVNRKGLQVNYRLSRGRSVLGACGQLRSEALSDR